MGVCCVLGAELLGQMEGDGLPLPVGVRGEVDHIDISGRIFDLLEHLGFAANGLVMGRKVMFDVHRHLAFGQIFDVAHRGFHHKAWAQILFDGFGFGR